MSCSRFKEMSFFTVLPKNCHHKLMLPKKFVKNCLVKEFSEITSTVSLKGQSGQVWAVELMRRNDELYLKKGWDIFVKEHDLKENDRLFFTYKLGVFDVLMFDNGNFCEKESSYFVRNCQGCHRSNGGLNERTRAEQVESEASIEIIEPEMQCYREKSITISDDDVEEDAPPRLLGRVPGCNSKAGGGRTEVSVTGNNNNEDSEEEINQVNPLAIGLGRRPAAKKVTHLAYQHAVSEGYRRGTPHFVVLIQSSHVSGNFFMAVPVESVKKYFPRASGDVSLQMNDKTWKAKFLYGGKGKSSGFLSSGWKSFVRENKVEVGNACLVEPITSSPSSLSSTTPGNQITFSISIFRNVL